MNRSYLEGSVKLLEMLKNDFSDVSNRGREAINPAGGSEKKLCAFKLEGPSNL